jgi:hypothetical protein
VLPEEPRAMRCYVRLRTFTHGRSRDSLGRDALIYTHRAAPDDDGGNVVGLV